MIEEELHQSPAPSTASSPSKRKSSPSNHVRNIKQHLHSTKPSTLRNPQLLSSDNGSGGILSYIRNYRMEHILLSHNHQQEENEESSHVTNLDKHKHSERSSPLGKREPSLEECISMLEPYLSTFRKRLRATTTAAESGKKGDEEKHHLPKKSKQNRSNPSSANDDTAAIPPRLLGIARLFKWKWHPIRRALLRPCRPNDDSSDQLEIGSAIRLRLARALHSKGLVAIAEVDGLIASFTSNTDADTNNRNPDDPEKEAFSNRIQMALSSLPKDIVHPANSARAIRHVQLTLEEYTGIWKDRQGQQSNHDESEPYLPTPAEVSEWILLSFTGCVLAHNGMAAEDEEMRKMESHLPAMIPLPPISNNATCDEDLPDDNNRNILGRALFLRLEQLLSPPCIDQLQNLQILIISKWLSHLQSSNHQLVVHLWMRSIRSCSQAKGGIGLASLPKLIAAYLHCCGGDLELLNVLEAKVIQEYGRPDTAKVGVIQVLQDDKKMRSEVPPPLMKEKLAGRLDDQINTDSRGSDLIRLVFSSSAYLLGYYGLKPSSMEAHLNIDEDGAIPIL